jgi:hypothetical protein
MRPLPEEQNGTKAATTPIPVQLSKTEFKAFIFPHLSMPKWGPKCTLDSLNFSQFVARQHWLWRYSLLTVFEPISCQEESLMAVYASFERSTSTIYKL